MSDKAYLPPRLLQGIGLLLLIFAVGFWAVTGHQSALLVGAALSLIGLGAYSGLHVSIKQEFSQGNAEKDGSNGA